MVRLFMFFDEKLLKNEFKILRNIFQRISQCFAVISVNADTKYASKFPRKLAHTALKLITRVITNN